MSKKQTYICGTLRSDRKGNSKEVVSKKLKKGEVEWKRRETVVVSKWKDKRDALTISNKHKLELVPVKNKRGEVRMKANIVRDYNNGMSGIDRSDQMLPTIKDCGKVFGGTKKFDFISSRCPCTTHSIFSSKQIPKTKWPSANFVLKLSKVSSTMKRQNEEKVAMFTIQI